METKLIVSDPTLMMGKPVIAGTRMEKMAAGETEEQRSLVKAFGLRSHSQQRR